MSELILHIGTPKTGTTSLQNFFFDNREALVKRGVDYVQFTPQKRDVIARWRNGCFLSRYCRALHSEQPIGNQVSDYEENYQRLVNALKNNKRVLLSDENFFAFSTMACKGQIDPVKYWRGLARIIKELGVESTTLIIYLRRQDECAVAMWKEAVKNGFSNKSIEDYINRPYIKCRLDYASNLDAIKEAFKDSGKIIVRSYNQVASSSTAIYHDFCESLDIAWDSDFKIPEGKRNESISFDMVEALRKCKYGGAGHAREEKRVRNMLAVTLSSKHKDPRGMTIFLPGEAKALMEQHLEGNRRIEKEYFDNQSLFSDEFIEGSPWHPNRLRIAGYRAAFICPKLLLKVILRQ